MAIALWALAISCGVLWSVAYDLRSGSVAEVPSRWPVGSVIVPSPDRANVLMFLHPGCSCSRASIAELGRIVEQSDGNPCVWVVVTGPRGADFGRSQSRLLEDIAAWPASQVYFDYSGDEAERFGCRTSGFTVAYDAAQQLVFQGGITAGRGHYGPNRASDELLAAVQQSHYGSAPVFGCPIITPPSDAF